MHMWLPNAISLLRLLLGVAFPWIPVEWRIPVVVLAAVTDGLDGYLSRWLRAESKLGVLLDPVADKVFFVGVAAALFWDVSVTWLEVLLIGLRDVIVVVGGVAARLRDGAAAWRQMPPRWLGKLATVMQFAFIAVVLLGAADWRGPVLIVTAVVSGLAGVDYVTSYLRLQSSGLPK